MQVSIAIAVIFGCLCGAFAQNYGSGYGSSFGYGSKYGYGKGGYGSDFGHINSGYGKEGYSFGGLSGYGNKGYSGYGKKGGIVDEYTIVNPVPIPAPIGVGSVDGGYLGSSLGGGLFGTNGTPIFLGLLALLILSSAN